MILTCPECATRYSVADDSVGPDGRTVRCKSCGLTWRAERDAALEPAPALVVKMSPALSGDQLPRAFRERIAAQHRGRKVAKSGLIWACAAAGFAFAIGGVVLGREMVARAWPKTATAYAAAGLPVNIVGLEIEARTEPLGFFEGRPAAIVTGTLSNVRDTPVSVPPLQFTLLDAKGGVLDSRVHTITDVEIEGGAKRTFAVRLVNPPEPTRDVGVSFVLRAAGKAHGGHIGASASGSGAKAGHGAAKPVKAQEAEASHEAHASAPAKAAALRPAHGGGGH